MKKDVTQDDEEKRKNKSKAKMMLRLLFFVVLSVNFTILGMFLYWFLRPNYAQVVSTLNIQDQCVVEDARHNSNADMIFWGGYFYLVHQNSKYHFASKTSRLIIYRSLNAIHWEKVMEIATGEDIRDPKFTVINDRLFMYALENVVWTAAPHQTVYTTSEDGIDWKPFESIQPDGWIFWRPKTNDQKTWYVPAYWKDLGKSALFRSVDGIHWSKVSVIHEGDKVNETAVEFMADGRMIAAARLEGSGGNFGDNDSATLIAISEYPYEEWSYHRNEMTRLDGPLLFRIGQDIFALGRFQPERDAFLFRQGSILSRKRTSLFRVHEGRLLYLSDLPSSGDTSYGGIVIQEGKAHIAYYSSVVNRDYPWIMGMFGRSGIRVLRIDVSSLAALAVRKTRSVPEGTFMYSPLQNYLVFIGLVFISILSSIMIIRHRWEVFE